ncbi:NAD(P)/FAD-dependent oxidoreductase [Desulfoluna spongiiphila]|uniref:Thioredoxin reductase n=1 Tax=Desulfoluna spongiiphila TaxID=419481 RepID=A0A1G5IQ77_9BACT|nr:NAD(P)/FAD-dependent oxidoreductase [Desulfoluna spongiiphila]SCY78246.1 Thioredoxin reductase [Desulfoluna spongiiphila]
MIQQQWDLVVIGAGPAGLSAAAAAAECGLEVVLLDEQAFAGGQIYRSVDAPGAKGRFLQKEDRAEGLRILRRFQKSGAAYEPRSTVWFAEPGRVLATRDAQTREYKTQNIVVATGAMERPVPFSGWTLPGVMAAGAADILYKSASVVPKGPIVVAGNGPLIPLITNHLLELGADIAAVVDTTPKANMMKAAPHMPMALRDIPFLFKGLKMVAKMTRSRVPIHRNGSDINAFGKDRLERVSFAVDGTPRSVSAATLLVHEGILPRTHMSRALGLDHAWNPVQRYWYPVCDENGKSSREGIYVAGDGVFVHGAAAAAAKGELAGIDVARSLQVLTDEDARRKRTRPRKVLSKALAPRKFVDGWFAPRKDLYEVDDDVLVCRCEGVTAAAIREAVKEGCHEVNDIKVRTRCGMGPCQGRMCGPALAEIAANALEREVPDVGSLRIRPPMRPVLFGEICGLGGGD